MSLLAGKKVKKDLPTASSFHTNMSIMKVSGAIILTTTTAAILLLGLPSWASAQTYSFSSPVTGGVTVTINPGTASGVPGPVAPFNNISGTITIDSVAATVRQSGFISASSFSTSSDFHLSQTNSPVFPNTQPTIVVGDLTVRYLGIGGGGVSFDTGALPLTYDAANARWDINYGSLGQLAQLSFNITWGYTLVTGGQTYDGLFSETLRSDQSGGFYAFSWIDTANYPSSVTLGDSVGGGPKAAGNTLDFTADNGFQLHLVAGFFSTKILELVNVTPTGTLTATLIPEPASESILLMGLLTGIFFRRASLTSHP